MTLINWCPRKGKTMETVKRLVIISIVGGGGTGERRSGIAERAFRTVRLLFTSLQWWVHAVMHMSKLIGCTA